jgi:hypothetical protein
MELTGLLEQTFGPLSPPLLRTDIRSLSRYFVDAHAERLRTPVEDESPEAGGPTASLTRTPMAYRSGNHGVNAARPRFAHEHTNNDHRLGRWLSPSSGWPDAIPVRNVNSGNL